MVGQTISKYQVLAELGSGAMGTVYKAQDIYLKRFVAIKVLADKYLQNGEMAARFEREARAVSMLAHPNVCAIFESGKWQGRPFLVMEFLDGKTLEERMGTARLSAQQVLRVATPVASALEAAHKAGIIHRDIKPGNIFLTSQGAVKVLDFGLAKVTREEPAMGVDAPTVVTFVTSPGAVLGTFAYMSPEQVRGEFLDGRADLYSLGVMIHELCTGALPVQGVVSPALPKELEPVLSRLIAPDKNKRYRDAGEARAALESLAA